MKYYTYGVLEQYKAAEMAEDMNMTEEQAAKTWFSEVLTDAEWDIVDKLPTHIRYVDEFIPGALDVEDDADQYESWTLYYDYGADYYFVAKEKYGLIEVTRYDSYDGDKYTSVYPIELDDEIEAEFKGWTREEIRQFLYDNCVGIRPCVGKDKFIPCIEIGDLSVSCQINYQVWSRRSDKIYERNIYDGEEYHNEMCKNITAEEFNAVLPDDDSWMDVRIAYGKVRCFLGQMSINEVADIFERLVSEEDEKVCLTDY